MGKQTPKFRQQVQTVEQYNNVQTVEDAFIQNQQCLSLPPKQRDLCQEIFDENRKKETVLRSTRSTRGNYKRWTKQEFFQIRRLSVTRVGIKMLTRMGIDSRVRKAAWKSLNPPKIRNRKSRYSKFEQKYVLWLLNEIIQNRLVFNQLTVQTVLQKAHSFHNQNQNLYFQGTQQWARNFMEREEFILLQNTQPQTPIEYLRMELQDSNDNNVNNNVDNDRANDSDSNSGNNVINSDNEKYLQLKGQNSFQDDFEKETWHLRN